MKMLNIESGLVIYKVLKQQKVNNKQVDQVGKLNMIQLKINYLEVYLVTQKLKRNYKIMQQIII